MPLTRPDQQLIDFAGTVPRPQGQFWADAMVNTLLLADDTAHAARAEGRDRLADTELSAIGSRYAGAIAPAGARTPAVVTRFTPRPARYCGASGDIAT